MRDVAQSVENAPPPQRSQPTRIGGDDLFAFERRCCGDGDQSLPRRARRMKGLGVALELSLPVIATELVLDEEEERTRRVVEYKVDASQTFSLERPHGSFTSAHGVARRVKETGSRLLPRRELNQTRSEPRRERGVSGSDRRDNPCPLSLVARAARGR
jgi:hypothetical protein